jgi:hypothetical protein
MLIKIFFGNQMDSSQFATHLRELRQHHVSLLKRYEKDVFSVIEHYADATGAFRDARYWALTLDFGRRHARMVLNWCDEAIRQIKDRGKEKSSQKKSANPPKN